MTFYAIVGLIPMLLLALFLASQGVGAPTVSSLAEGLTRLLPDELGTRDAARFLADSGTSMSVLAAVAALVPASLYGEGPVQAFDRLSEWEGRRLSLRGRLGSLVVVVVVTMSPALLLAGLNATETLTSAIGHGLSGRLLGIYFAFLVGWFTITPFLAFAYRGLSPERPGKRALLWGAAGTGSFLSGTCLVYVFFLSLGLDLGGAYGGSLGLANAVASVGWLFVLHVIVLIGYVTTLALHARGGRPLGLRG